MMVSIVDGFPQIQGLQLQNFAIVNSTLAAATAYFSATTFAAKAEKSRREFSKQDVNFSAEKVPSVFAAKSISSCKEQA